MIEGFFQVTSVGFDNLEKVFKIIKNREFIAFTEIRTFDKCILKLHTKYKPDSNMLLIPLNMEQAAKYAFS